MLIALIIISMLFAMSVAFIFYLIKVLKNTLNMVDNLSDIANGKTPRSMKKAYNNKYYPAAVIAQVIFDSPHESKIIDFSRYDKGIVGFTIMTSDSMEKYYGADLLEELDDEMLKELNKPVLIKKALVYEVKEGDWLWKSVE